LNSRQLINRLLEPVRKFLKDPISHIRSFFLIQPGELKDFISRRNHSPLFSNYRGRFILSRVRIVAMTFAILTPMWIVVDYLFFPSWVATVLANGRILASVAFALLALLCRHPSNIRNSLYAISALFLIPTAFFVFTRILLAGVDLNTMAAAMAAGYLFLPFVLVSGLALFPLTVLETSLFSLPLLCVFLVSFIIQKHTIMPHINDLVVFWLLMLIAAIGNLASMSHFQFMKGLFEQSSFDALTGSLNRRTGEHYLALQVAQARRKSFPLSIAFLDIDNFKNINDRFGHEIGDSVLMDVSNTIGGAIRESDSVVRWGGEEFLLIMPYVDSEQAHKRIESILHSRTLQLPDGNPITFSGGVAEYSRDGNDWHELINLADTRMYEAKHAGKARIISGSTSLAKRPRMASA
jgi:diguanylate cyclase (GGDEF)-like protein